MHATRLLSLVLASVLSLAAANPLLSERQLSTCGCQSPSGCPGTCSGTGFCLHYCETNTTVFCDACGDSTSECILSNDGTCFIRKVSIRSARRGFNVSSV
ncbi:hypothetical protein DFH08DRAFT_883073 [Mycena albidolilacea]|uniref:Uncharacterized protein n=1 Tax=Mycena albidolilacea TaxID=1033008 RepID=A0AAD6ZN35_9AGAR|nr:hypothetical protein DFH08DRAFT_883073 [Mycena albidolilacea]